MTTRHPSHRPPPPPPPPARRCGASQRRGFRAFGRSLADRPSRPVPGERRSSPRHSLPLPATGICPSLCIVFRLLFGRYPPPGRPSGPACPSLARCSPRGWASDRVPLPQLPSSLCRFLRCCPRPSDLRPPPPHWCPFTVLQGLSPGGQPPLCFAHKKFCPLPVLTDALSCCRSRRRHWFPRLTSRAPRPPPGRTLGPTFLPRCVRLSSYAPAPPQLSTDRSACSKKSTAYDTDTRCGIVLCFCYGNKRFDARIERQSSLKTRSSLRHCKRIHQKSHGK